jgi:hypothetical protein
MAPTANPASMARKVIQIPPESVLSGGTICVRIIAITIPERFAEAMIERLIPEVSIGSIIAKVRIPNSGSCEAMDLRFLRLRKLMPLNRIINPITASKASIRIVK